MACIFCDIIERKIPAQIVYEDERVLAFHDIQPAAPVHILIVPKKHIASIIEMTDEDEEVMGHLILVAQKIAAEKNLPGYKLQFNVGKEGGQVVFHVHLHLLGGWKEGRNKE